MEKEKKNMIFRLRCVCRLSAVFEKEIKMFVIFQKFSLKFIFVSFRKNALKVT